jgi:outer membrane protein OmpA-like peptidoglycan-associated protein
MAVNEEIDLSKISTYKEIKRDLYLIPIEAGSVINLQSVQFERNSDIFIQSSYGELDRMVEIMKKYPNMYIELSGHTDTRGNPQLLLQLSSKRVVAVKNYLIKKGIPANRIIARGYGGSKPLGTGSEEIEIKNRRVEFKILKM